MTLEILNPVVRSDGKLVADVKATDYGFTLSVECWASLCQEWGTELTRLYLLKEAIPIAQVNLSAALSNPETTEEQTTALKAFAAELAAEIPVRVDAFYSGLLALASVAEDEARAAQYQAEWDAWHAAHPDVTGIAGAV